MFGTSTSPSCEKLTHHEKDGHHGMLEVYIQSLGMTLHILYPYLYTWLMLPHWIFLGRV